MPHKRPNFQRIIPTNDPPKVIEPFEHKEPEVVKEEPFFQQRTVRFDLPQLPSDETARQQTTLEEERPYYEPSQLFSNPKKDPAEEHLQKNDDGFYSLRKNYERIKPGSKYAEEGIRPQSPNLPYSFLSKETIKKNQQHTDSVYEPTTVYSNSIPKRERHYKERPTACFNEHLIRGLSAPQPYCWIAKEANNNYPPPEYTNSRYGSYPTWGVEETGFRTRSHYVGEPANRFGNIDMYKRPLTNQPGKIIFDHGRPNNGYNLQRHQYDNTWFNSSIKLNQQDILKSIAPKIKDEYNFIEGTHQNLIRAKSMIWPPHSEYVQKFALKNNT